MQLKEYQSLRSGFPTTVLSSPPYALARTGPRYQTLLSVGGFRTAFPNAGTVRSSTTGAERRGGCGIPVANLSAIGQKIKERLEEQARLSGNENPGLLTKTKRDTKGPTQARPTL